MPTSEAVHEEVMVLGRAEGGQLCGHLSEGADIDELAALLGLGCAHAVIGCLPSEGLDPSAGLAEVLKNVDIYAQFFLDSWLSGDTELMATEDSS